MRGGLPGPRPVPTRHDGGGPTDGSALSTHAPTTPAGAPAPPPRGVTILIVLAVLVAAPLALLAIRDVAAGPPSRLLLLTVVAVAMASRGAVPFLTLRQLSDRDRLGYGVLVAPALATMDWAPFVVACTLAAGLGWLARRLPALSLAQPARRSSEVLLSIARLVIAATLATAVAHAPIWTAGTAFAAAMIGATVFVIVEAALADLAVALAERVRFGDAVTSETGRAVPVEVFSLACGVFVTRVVEAYAFDAVWILLAALVSLALAMTMSASEHARSRYQALLRLTASAEAGTSPEDVEQIVVGTVADLVNAEHGELRDDPPTADELGVRLRFRRRRRWLVVGRRRGLARSFTVRDRDLLQAAGPLVARVIGEAVERAGMSSLAGTDPLTGLANRRGLEQEAARLLAEDEHRQRCTVVAVLDADRFKQINDELGHDVGDRLLVELGDALRASAREQDVLARIGGDEFVVVAGNLPGPDLADEVAHRIRRDLDGLQAPDGRSMRVSLGVAVAPEDGDHLDALLRAADRRMYEDKRDHD